jgi:DNA-binding NarL/FixJ family response regulator
VKALVITDQPLVALGMQAALRPVEGITGVDVAHPGSPPEPGSGAYRLLVADLDAYGACWTVAQRLRQRHPEAALVALTSGPSPDISRAMK